MRADRVEASWDGSKKKWLFRIQTGEEVLRRYCDVPKDAAESALRSTAQKALQDEGYDSELNELTIKR